MKVGYIRISTPEQNTARQEVLMQELGVEKVFLDRMSGKNTDRPQLKQKCEKFLTRPEIELQKS